LHRSGGKDSELASAVDEQTVKLAALKEAMASREGGLALAAGPWSLKSAPQVEGKGEG
jgi:hypothetical protein